MADTIYLIRDGYLYKHREADGASYLKKGSQETVTCLGTVAEAEVKYPNELASARGLRHAIHQIPPSV